MQQDGRALVLKFKRPTRRMEEYIVSFGVARGRTEIVVVTVVCASLNL